MIAMDQRNAGQSAGPLEAGDPWGAYAADQLAVMDHLGIDRFLVFGCCIGGPFILKLCELAPERVVAAVLEQPVGIIESNRELFDSIWKQWGERLAGERDDLGSDEIEAFATAMWAPGFAVSVTRDQVRSFRTPMLVLPGVDEYHPAETGREIATLAPPRPASSLRRASCYSRYSRRLPRTWAGDWRAPRSGDGRGNPVQAALHLFL